MKKIKIIKLIIFILIFFLIFYYVVKLLWAAPTSLSYFYKEPKNSLDVVYIGSSNAFTHFNNVLAYNLYGFTTGFLSTDSQAFVLSKYMIKESEKYQHPYLYIIDLAKAVDIIDLSEEYGLRRTIDSMKFSKNRIDAINELLKYKTGIDKSDYINYYFSFLFYHNKWKRPSISNITGTNYLYKGYFFDKLTTEINSFDTYHWVDETMEIQEESKQILNSLIEYIKDNNINVLFVLSQKTFKEENNKQLNTVINILKENNLKVLNFNTLDDFNSIDFKNDYYNESHLNVNGATKYTLYFSRYLKENYNLPDHRENPEYKIWNQEYERFKADYKRITKKEFNELLKEYNN